MVNIYQVPFHSLLREVVKSKVCHPQEKAKEIQAMDSKKSVLGSQKIFFKTWNSGSEEGGNTMTVIWL